MSDALRVWRHVFHSLWGVNAETVNPEDVTFTVVQNCKTVIESLEANYPEFASLITDVLPNVRAPASS